MASPVKVNHNAVVNLDSSISSLAIPVSVAQNKLVVVNVGIRSAVVSVSSVTDDQGNTYTQQAHARANQEIDFSTGGLSKAPILRNYVQGECWTATQASATAATKVTVTLTSGAKFGVEVQTFTGSAFGVTGSATFASSSSPSITATTQTNGSWLVASFSSAYSLNETATAGTIDDEISGSGTQDQGGVSVTLAHLLKATAGATTITLAPSNTEVQDGVTFDVPATYAVTAIEVKG